VCGTCVARVTDCFQDRPRCALPASLHRVTLSVNDRCSPRFAIASGTQRAWVDLPFTSSRWRNADASYSPMRQSRQVHRCPSRFRLYAALLAA
jgi:hypothetical protein